MKNQLQFINVTAIGLLLLTSSRAYSDCYGSQPVRCAQMNVDFCYVLIHCNGVGQTKRATCTQDAYTYPAFTAPAWMAGIDRIISVPDCMFPASYLDCNNNPVSTVCGPTSTYTTVDWDNGQACQTQGGQGGS